MKKLLSKKERARRQSIRRSPQIKKAIRRLDPAHILTLDLETTGLDADAEIIQLSVMNGCGDVLMNRYFKPLYTERWDEAMEVNHITPQQVEKEDPFILWADRVSELFMDADLIVGYSTFNDVAKLHAAGVVLPDRDIYLDLAEAFSLIHYKENKTITYAKLMNCAAHYGYQSRRSWHDSLTDTDATLFCFRQMLDDDQAIFKKRRYPQISG
ncbi:exonuclease domain-containing protein [Megasphaera sp.]|uniref:3'-5' exonuclease n=1 Tax=Megasphaera sp. TaxID=2023260 RepID=UPI0025EB73A8|nr:exonuclease domain-containing protein [uncultured Megasphaera sp.]